MTPDSGPDNRLPEQKPKPKAVALSLFIIAASVLSILEVARSGVLFASTKNAVRERRPDVLMDAAKFAQLDLADGAQDDVALIDGVRYQLAQRNADGSVSLQGVQDGPDIIGPARLTGPGMKEAVLPVRSTAAILFCYDNSADCGSFAEDYCRTRGGVEFQAYVSGADIPCRVTCANNEGAQCSEPPPNTAPAPKKPGDVTLRPRVTVE